MKQYTLFVKEIAIRWNYV